MGEFLLDLLGDILEGFLEGLISSRQERKEHKSSRQERKEHKSSRQERKEHKALQEAGMRKSTGMWQCPSCGTGNPRHRGICQSCGEQKPMM